MWTSFLASIFVVLLGIKWAYVNIGSTYFRNYDSELFAFSVRLGEKFDDSKIREAFVDQSHVEMEAERHRALEMGSEDEFAITSNDRLAEIGSKFLTETLEAYVRFAFPFWPEEGVQALVAFLNSKEVQAEISFHIGTRDLIFAKVGRMVHFLFV